MNFKITTNQEAITESAGTSSYISKSGIYDVTIVFASLDVSAKGAESVNFNLLYNGESQTIYGPYVTGVNGETNQIGAKLINKLGIIAGMTDNDELEIEEQQHAVGKDKKVQDFAVITNFSDLPIKIRLQEEYSVNPKTNATQKRMVIKNFYSEAGATAEEIVNETPTGVTLAKELEKYAHNVTYKDGLTPEAVEEWRASKSTAAVGPKAKTVAPVAKKAGSLFK